MVPGAQRTCSPLLPVHALSVTFPHSVHLLNILLKLQAGFAEDIAAHLVHLCCQERALAGRALACGRRGMTRQKLCAIWSLLGSVRRLLDLGFGSFVFWGRKWASDLLTQYPKKTLMFFSYCLKDKLYTYSTPQSDSHLFLLASANLCFPISLTGNSAPMKSSGANSSYLSNPQDFSLLIQKVPLSIFRPPRILMFFSRLTM